MMRFAKITLAICLLSGHAVAGGIEYPALGNIDGAEGTLEIWFTPMIDLGMGDESVSYQNRFKIFHWEVPDRYTISGGSWRRSGRALAGASMGSPLFNSALINTYGSVPKTWANGKPCHFAFVWDGQDMRFFGDGQPMGYRKQVITLATLLNGRMITIGNIKGRDTRVVIHAVRISAIARSAESLAESKPIADIYTLLLDRFMSETDRSAEVISGFSGETGGSYQGVCRFVSAPLPGLAMFRGD